MLAVYGKRRSVNWQKLSTFLRNVSNSTTEIASRSLRPIFAVTVLRYHMGCTGIADNEMCTRQVTAATSGRIVIFLSQVAGTQTWKLTR
jgi:hypothetical protein